jgi:hypothetical protein
LWSAAQCRGHFYWRYSFASCGVLTNRSWLKVNSLSKKK